MNIKKEGEAYCRYITFSFHAIIIIVLFVLLFSFNIPFVLGNAIVQGSTCPGGQEPLNKHWVSRTCRDGNFGGNNGCGCGTPEIWSKTAPGCSYGLGKKCEAREWCYADTVDMVECNSCNQLLSG